MNKSHVAGGLSSIGGNSQIGGGGCCWLMKDGRQPWTKVVGKSDESSAVCCAVRAVERALT